MIEHLGEWWQWLSAPERAVQSVSWCFVIVVTGLACWTAVAAGDRRRERLSLAQQRARRQRRHRTTRRIRLGPVRTGVAVCTCCWSPIALGEAPHSVRCGSCGGLQHADCARWIGGCGRYGCGRPTTVPTATTPAAVTTLITSPRRAAH
jgi:hypothetical protein